MQQEQLRLCVEMPIYEYRCRGCKEVSAFLTADYEYPQEIECEHCGEGDTYRIISRVAYHQSEADRTAALDPKYGKMIDHAMASTPEADPDRHLRKMKPFSSSDD